MKQYPLPRTRPVLLRYLGQGGEEYGLGVGVRFGRGLGFGLPMRPPVLLLLFSFPFSCLVFVEDSAE